MNIRTSSLAAGGGGGLGSAVSTILIWILQSSAHLEVPDSVQLAIGVVISAALALVFAAVSPPQNP